MIKAWLSMWKNAFNFSGTATRKEYWLALIMNYFVILVGTIPYALLLKLVITDLSSVAVMSVLYVIALSIPAVSLYFRRARHAGWTLRTTLFCTVLLPGFSPLLVGVITSKLIVPKSLGIPLRVMAVGFGLALYSVFLTMIFQRDLSGLYGAGILVTTAGLLLFTIFRMLEARAASKK